MIFEENEDLETEAIPNKGSSACSPPSGHAHASNGEHQLNGAISELIVVNNALSEFTDGVLQEKLASEIFNSLRHDDDENNDDDGDEDEMQDLENWLKQELVLQSPIYIVQNLEEHARAEQEQRSRKGDEDISIVEPQNESNNASSSSSFQSQVENILNVQTEQERRDEFFEQLEGQRIENDVNLTTSRSIIDNVSGSCFPFASKLEVPFAVHPQQEQKENEEANNQFISPKIEVPTLGVYLSEKVAKEKYAVSEDMLGLAEHIFRRMTPQMIDFYRQLRNSVSNQRFSVVAFQHRSCPIVDKTTGETIEEKIQTGYNVIGTFPSYEKAKEAVILYRKALGQDGHNICVEIKSVLGRDFEFVPDHIMGTSSSSSNSTTTIDADRRKAETAVSNSEFFSQSLIGTDSIDILRRAWTRNIGGIQHKNELIDKNTHDMRMSSFAELRLLIEQYERKVVSSPVMSNFADTLSYFALIA